MTAKPLDLTLEVAPKARFDVVEMRSRFAAEHEALAGYSNCLYWSSHTTAGFLDRSISARLSAQHVSTYVDAFRALFPEGAGYEHDQLDRRSDLDGIVDGRPRRRLTRVIGFRSERVVGKTRIEVPVSDHPIDSINLKDPRLGIYPALAEFVSRTGGGKGQLRIMLDPAERHSALTVNEYETLLMKYDLAEVLRNPLRFVAQQYRNAMKNPRAVPAKTLGYAKYDFVRVMNTGLDTLRLRGSVVEKLLAKTLAVPAARFLRMRRSVSLLVSECEDGTLGIVEGTYQSPILVQWQNAPRQSRMLDVTLTELR